MRWRSCRGGLPSGRAVALTCVLALAFHPDATRSKPRQRDKGKTYTVDESTSALLSPEKQSLVRNFVQQMRRMGSGTVELPKVDSRFHVGEAVPETASLFILPHDAFSDVPQVTSYRFLLAADGILAVDPHSRRVVQIIEAP